MNQASHGPHFADRPFRDTTDTIVHEKFVNASARNHPKPKGSSAGGSWTIVNIKSGKFDPFSTDRKRLQLKYVPECGANSVDTVKERKEKEESRKKQALVRRQRAKEAARKSRERAARKREQSMTVSAEDNNVNMEPELSQLERELLKLQKETDMDLQQLELEVRARHEKRAIRCTKIKQGLRGAKTVGPGKKMFQWVKPSVPSSVTAPLPKKSGKDRRWWIEK